MSAPLGIHKTEIIASYLKAVFVAELRGDADNVPLPDWSMNQLDLLEECNYASKMLVQATKNLSECIEFLDEILTRPNHSGCMSWSVIDYLEVLRAGGKGLEENLRQIFPSNTMEMIYKPCIVVDSDGKILLWYLPRMIDLKRRVSDFGRRFHFGRLNNQIEFNMGLGGNHFKINDC
jgi:hypothetical protein